MVLWLYCGYILDRMLVLMSVIASVFLELTHMGIYGGNDGRQQPWYLALLPIVSQLLAEFRQ